MRGAINLIGKTIEVDEILYEVTNINFIPNNNNFYVELENDGNILNISLKDLSSHINEQLMKNIESLLIEKRRRHQRRIS